MKLNLHPEAMKRLDEKAAELVKRVRPTPKHLNHKPGPANPNIHTVHSFTPENMVGEMTLGWSDFTGATKARAFADDKQVVGLFEADYEQLVQIADSMSRSIEPPDLITAGTLENFIFDWVKQAYRGNTNEPMSASVLLDCEKVIRRCEIWIPISRFYIAAPFSFGRVAFKAITKQLIDDWQTNVLAKATEPSETDAINKGFERHRAAIQGLAVAIMTREAEPQQAYELCFEEVDRTIGILRFFWYGHLHPQKICYVAPFGSQHEDSYRFLIVNEGKIVGHHAGLTDRSRIHWNFGREEFETFGPELNILHTLLVSNERTDFQDMLLDALVLYSRSFLAKRIPDKLIYIFAAIESIFLKNSGELIQDSISLRMAYMHDVSVESRKNMIANIKSVYKLRSLFIHHGRRIDAKHLVVLEEFMRNAWLSVAALILLAPSGITREGFFDYLENRRLGG